MVEYYSEIRKKIGHDTLLVVGAGVFIYKNGKVLLQKRKDGNCWAMHGGSVGIGEVVEDAAKRELFEETGLTANKLELLGVFSGDDRILTYSNGDKVYSIGVVYVCNDFWGELKPQVSEVKELKWFELNKLPEEIWQPNIKPLKAFVEYIKATV